MDDIRANDKNSRVDFGVVIGISAVAAALMALFEYGMGGGLPGHLHLAYAGICSFILLPLVVWRFKVEKLIIYITLLIVLYAIWALPFTTRKMFLRDFSKIKPGMTASRVKMVMKPYKYYSKPGVYYGFSATTRVYRHSDAAPFEGDLGVVYFRDGKVVNAEFMAD